ncbi:MAG TPA: helix-turn-helix transcriptional regulator, partial [Chloroflexota bacterium]|nr:helix-turn-helix transcriptional regulator [Chloroflexota bacterium]
DQLRAGRTVAEWKLAGWNPASSAEVVTGETLRTRREALGISQAAVAHAAHCSRGLVAEVERGKRRSAQTLSHLSSVLDRLEQQARRN